MRFIAGVRHGKCAITNVITHDDTVEDLQVLMRTIDEWLSAVIDRLCEIEGEE